MSFTTCASRTRFIAKGMLFVWLFSLAVGVANACVVQQGRSDAPTQDHRAALLALASADHAVAAVPMPGMAGARDPHAPNASQQACKSFCDIEQSAVVKTRTLVLLDAPPLIVSTHSWQALDVARVDVHWRLAVAAPPPGPPVAIRFLRLLL